MKRRRFMPVSTMLPLANRLASFAMWDAQYAPLALAGFFAVTPFGTPPIVQCYCCGLLDGLWREDFDPLERHVRLSQHCDLAVMRWRERQSTSAFVPYIRISGGYRE